MDKNIYGLLVPHAPTLLEDETAGRQSEVIVALQDVGRKLTAWGADVIIAVTTHWQSQGKFLVDDSAFHRTLTDYYGFNTEVEYDVAGEPQLAELLLAAGRKQLVFADRGRRGVDHGITIPLHFMFPEKHIPVVPLSISGDPLGAFRWGRVIGKELSRWGGKAVFMVSGSLSHDLASFGAGRQLEDHGVFDQTVINLLATGKGMDVLEINRQLIAAAKPEGGFRDLCMLLGVMGAEAIGRKLAYEALPGVGQGVVEFDTPAYGRRDDELLAAAPPGTIMH